MPNLITRRSEVEANILAYDHILDHLNTFTAPQRATMLSTLSHTQAWFCINRGRWIAAPAKFIGYCMKDGPMTGDAYHSFRRSHLSGTLAEAQVSRVCGYEEAGEKHPAVAALKQKCAALGKRLRASSGFYLLRGESLDISERRQVDSFATLVENAELSRDALAILVERIQRVSA